MRIPFALAAALLLAPGLAGCGRTSTSAPLAPSTQVVTPAPAPVPVAPQELIRGSITDTAWRAVAGARVEVLDGPQAGASAITDQGGLFAFPGVFDDSIRFRASKDGYVEAIRASPAPACASCSRWIHFELESASASALDLAGEYDLTFIAAESCAAIPPDLRSRTYVASVTQDPASRWRYVVSVSGASLVHGHSWEGITMGTTTDHASLYVGNYHGDPGVIDQVEGHSYLSFDGWMSIGMGQPAATSLSGAFEGYIDYCVLPPGSPSPVASGRYVCGAGPGTPGTPGTRASCMATNHRLTLTRR